MFSVAISLERHVLKCSELAKKATKPYGLKQCIQPHGLIGGDRTARELQVG